MSSKISIIDYGVGNMSNVVRAFEYSGADISVVDTPEAVKGAEKLLLPGVGAFQDGMMGLAERGLIDPIKEFATSKKPFMGICLGMQMMMDFSDEFGRHDGLGLISGGVVKIPSEGLDGNPHKIPHIGWNELVLPQGRRSWDDTCLEGISTGTPFYFVHSFMVVPDNESHRVGDCIYDGRAICGAIRSGMLMGFQFHPEKSGEAGLTIIRNFIKL